MITVTVDVVPRDIKHTLENKKAIQKRITRKITTLNKYDKQAVKRYKEAYKAVYGVPPKVKRDGKWFRIHGQSAGVTRQRLVEMAKQLEYRAGV